MFSFNSWLFFVTTLFKVLLYQSFARYSSSYPHLGEFLHQQILLSRRSKTTGVSFSLNGRHILTRIKISVVKVIFKNEHELVKYILFSLDCILWYTPKKTEFYFPGLKVFCRYFLLIFRAASPCFSFQAFKGNSSNKAEIIILPCVHLPKIFEMYSLTSVKEVISPIKTSREFLSGSTMFYDLFLCLVCVFVRK